MYFTSKASCSNDPEEIELQPNQSSDNKKEVPSPLKTSEHHIHIDSSQQHSNISPSEKNVHQDENVKHEGNFTSSVKFPFQLCQSIMDVNTTYNQFLKTNNSNTCWICLKELKAAKSASHMKRHWNSSILCHNHRILPCHVHKRNTHQDPCYHCPLCQKTFMWKKRLLQHSCPMKADDKPAVNSSWKCPLCQKSVLWSNRQHHLRTQHKDNNEQTREVFCVDAKNKSYMVRASKRGPSNPIHVQFQINLGNQPSKVFCTDESCRDAHCIDNRNVSYRCEHIKSIIEPVTQSHEVLIAENIWTDLIDKKIFSSGTVSNLKSLSNLAKDEHVPLASYSKFVDGRIHVSTLASLSDRRKNYSMLNRIISTYYPRQNEWTCSCHITNQKCQHVKMSMVCLYNDGLYNLHGTTKLHTEVQSNNDCHKAYPPSGILMDKMYDYQMFHKIPVELPKELIEKLDNIDECPNDLIPTEEKCYFCGHSLGKPKLVSSKAKLITMSGVREKMRTCYKTCPSCNVPYPYSDINHIGIYNFDDTHLLSLKLLLFVWNSLIIHTTPSRVFEALSATLGSNIGNISSPVLCLLSL